MSRVLKISCLAAGLLFNCFLLACRHPHSSSSNTYWMYVGSYTARGAQGVYLFRLQPSTGKVEAAGLAAGRFWQANNDSFTAGVPRMWAQLRAEWPSPRQILRGVQNPVYLAVHPTQKYLYTADDIVPGSAVSAFRIDPATGKLTLLNQKPTAGNGPTYVAVDRAGKNLLVADFSGGEVEVFPIAGDGSLRDATCVVRHKGSGENGKVQPHPHSINPSPDDKYAVATDLGLDEVLVYRFNSERGMLTADHPGVVKTPPGSGARHFRFHPNGRFAYVIEEAGSSVMAMQWDGARGVLTPTSAVRTLPADFHGPSATAELMIHPNGRFLYGSNRGHDSIAVFAIDAEKGTLAPVEFASTRGSRPRSFAIDPSGKYLFAANVESQNVVQFRIDQSTGRLSPTGVSLQVPYPASIGFAAAN